MIEDFRNAVARLKTGQDLRPEDFVALYETEEALEELDDVKIKLYTVEAELHRTKELLNEVTKDRGILHEALQDHKNTTYSLEEYVRVLEAELERERGA